MCFYHISFYELLFYNFFLEEEIFIVSEDNNTSIYHKDDTREDSISISELEPEAAKAGLELKLQ